MRQDREASRSEDRDESSAPDRHVGEWPFPHVRALPAPPGMRTLILVDDDGNEMERLMLPAAVMNDLAEGECLHRYRDRLITRRPPKLPD